MPSFTCPARVNQLGFGERSDHRVQAATRPTKHVPSKKQTNPRQSTSAGGCRGELGTTRAWKDMYGLSISSQTAYEVWNASIAGTSLDGSKSRWKPGGIEMQPKNSLDKNMCFAPRSNPFCRHNSRPVPNAKI